MKQTNKNSKLKQRTSATAQQQTNKHKPTYYYKMMMSKAIILPFFLLAGIASGSQQSQGIVSNTYDGEDDEGGSLLQRRNTPYGEDDVDRDEDATYFEDEDAVHSTNTDFYDDNNDEEILFSGVQRLQNHKKFKCVYKAKKKFRPNLDKYTEIVKVRLNKKDKEI